MKVIQTGIKDLVVIEPRVFEDDRGYFFESFNDRTFEKNFKKVHFVQDNEAKSTYGVLRGLHYQTGDYAQSKLVRMVEGRVLDVAVDIRKGSPTYGKWFSVELSAENKRQLFVPKGFAHGYIVLSSTAIFSYKCDNFYSKEHEAGLAYDDRSLDIDWKVPFTKIVLSEKDQAHPSFKNLTPSEVPYE